MLAVQLGLAVEVGWPRGSVSFIGSISGTSRKDIVGRDVYEENAASCAECGKRARCLDIDGARAFWVLVDLVREAVGGTMNYDLWSVCGAMAIRWLINVPRRLCLTNFTSSIALSTSAALERSTLRIDVPSAREKPVPLTVQLPQSNNLQTCLPSSPVAPVTRTVLELMTWYGSLQDIGVDTGPGKYPRVWGCQLQLLVLLRQCGELSEGL